MLFRFLNLQFFTYSTNVYLIVYCVPDTLLGTRKAEMKQSNNTLVTPVATIYQVVTRVRPSGRSNTPKATNTECWFSVTTNAWHDRNTYIKEGGAGKEKPR